MAKIKSYVRPRRLYRYRTLEHFDCEMHAIETGYVFCSAYMKLNDPMEGIFSSSKHLSQNDDHHEIRNAVTSNKAQIGICSFSEVYDHEMMWAHYADQFRGICIAYSFSKLLKNLAKDIRFVRMYYSEAGPIINSLDADKEPAEIAKMILSYKNYRWLYEREWRMFGPLGRTYYHKPACVTDVYLGSRITDADRDRVRNRLGRLRIETHDMTIQKYAISFEALRT